MSSLPDKPSELIRVALADLAKCEASPDYTIEMSVWHRASHTIGKCIVCLAGAVMAQTFNVPKDKSTVPGSVTDTESHKLVALDDFRNGYIHNGLFTMKVQHGSDIIEYMDIEFYSESPAQFRADMNKMADYLESKGL